MKKFLLAIVVLTIMSAIEVSAQSNFEAGLRFGNNFSAEATIPISKTPRLHPAIYFDEFALATYFDWMFKLQGTPNGFKFYPGVGPELYLADEVEIGLAGNFGVEYEFDFPLTVGFDWRPSLLLTEGDFLTENWGFTARLRFSKAY